MLELTKGCCLEIKNQKVTIDITDMIKVRDFYEVGCIQEYVYENYEVTEAEALEISRLAYEYKQDGKEEYEAVMNAAERLNIKMKSLL